MSELIERLDQLKNKADYYRCKPQTSDSDAAMFRWLEELEAAWPTMRAALLTAQSARKESSK